MWALVASTVADRFFERLFGSQTKRGKKRYRSYKFIFLDMNTEFLELGLICSVQHQFLCAKVQTILVPLHFWLVPFHFVCFGDGSE